MTKPITGVAILMLQDEGKLDVADPVAKYIPEFANLKETGALSVAPPRRDYDGSRERPPQGNGGLYSTPSDYARFCQMLLNRGSLGGRRHLSERAFATLTSVHTGNLETGFFRASYGAHYGWGIGTCILRQPHEGVAGMLSPGTFGHGGAWGTQAWIDPVKGVAYLLMVQRANFPNSDGSDVRRVFQQAAVDALAKKT